MPIQIVNNSHFNTDAVVNILAENALVTGSAPDAVRALLLAAGIGDITGTSNAATVSGSATLPGDLTVTGTTTTQGNLTINSAGSTYNNVLFTGWVEVNANNVTMNNCRVRVDSGANEGVKIGPNVTGTYLNKVEIGGGSNGVTNTGVAIGLLFGDNSGSAYNNHAYNVWIHHCIDGIRADGNCWFDWSRVSNMDTSGYRGDGTGTHGDGSQSTGWGGIKFTNSEIDSGNNDAIFLNQESGNPAIGTVVIDYCKVNGYTGSQPGGPPNTWQSSYGIRITAGGPCNVTNTEIAGSFDGYAFGTFNTWTNNTRNGSPIGAP